MITESESYAIEGRGRDRRPAEGEGFLASVRCAMGRLPSTCSQIERQTLTATEVAHGRGYRLFGKLARLGAIASADKELSAVAIEHVRALVDDTGKPVTSVFSRVRRP